MTIGNGVSRIMTALILSFLVILSSCSSKTRVTLHRIPKPAAKPLTKPAAKPTVQPALPAVQPGDNAANKMLAISAISSQVTNEDTPIEVSFNVSDSNNALNCSTFLSYVSSNPALISNTGAVAFAGTAPDCKGTISPNANQNGNAQVSFSVNNGSAVATSIFDLSVMSVNDPPVVSDVTDKSTVKNTASNGTAVTITDLDSTLTCASLSGASSNTILLPNANITFAGTAPNCTANLNPAANQTGSATVTLTATDTALTATDTFVFTVNAVNDAPVISDITDKSTDEDTALNGTTVTITDIDSTLTCASLSGASSNTTLLPNANITFAGTAPNCTVNLNPAADQAGTATVTLTVTDTALTATDAFVLTVNAVNDGPVISDVTDKSTDEDTALNGTTVTITDPDSTLTCASLSGASSNTTLLPNNRITFAGTAPNCTVNLNPAANQAGSATVTLTLTDSVLTASDTFVLTVNAVNDAPRVLTITSQITNEDAPLAVGFTVTDPDNILNCSSDTTYFSNNTALVSNSGAVVFSGGGTNCTGTISATANQIGTAQISFSVSDGTLLATSTFDLSVVAVNDAPAISNVTDKSTDEDTALNSTTVTITDIDSTLTCASLSGTSSNTTLMPNANITFAGTAPNCTVNLNPAANQAGSATVTLTVTDTALTATDTFVLTVNAVNDAPVISVLQNVIAGPAAVSAQNFTLTDVDNNLGSCASALVTAVSSSTGVLPNAAIAISGTAPNCTLTVTRGANPVGTSTLTFTFSDGTGSVVGNLSYTATTTPEYNALSLGNGSQRRAFFDQTTNKHWAVVFDANNGSGRLRVENSADGTAWNAVEVLANESSDFAVTARSGDMYLVSSSGAEVTVRRGVLSSGSITFLITRTVFSAGAGETFTAPSAVLNASGHLWVAAVHSTSNGSLAQVRRSTNLAATNLASFESVSSLGKRTSVRSVALVPRSGDDLFLAVQSNAVEGFAFDGTAGTWSPQMVGGVKGFLSMGGTGGIDGAVNAAVWNKGELYAGGVFTTAGGVTVNRVAKWNGTAWSALSTGTNEEVSALAADSNGNLYAAGSFTTAGGVSANGVARWNGTTWSALGSGMDNVVLALAFDSGGTLYAGGAFTTAGGVAANYIAKWNGTAWSSVGTGMNSPVMSLAADSSGNLYAGGIFTAAGGAGRLRVARWNGTTWSALGTGAAGTVSALAVDSGGNLYAGGYFTTAGGVTVNRVARWNGTTWSALGTGMDQGVIALAVDSSGNLYAGGLFTTAGGVTVNRVAKWNGSAWSAFGSGMENNVNGLAVDRSGNLYAGGSFTTAGGVTVNRFAKWNGTAWSALGLGIDNSVHALSVDSSGNVYAGGSFTTAGGVTANRVARWNGTGWNALGTGMDATVTDLATDSSGNLYAGGLFTTAGGVTVNRVAKWNGSAWSALGSGVDNTVNALAVDGTGNLYAGGFFTTAGGVTVNRIAKWDPTANTGAGAWSAIGAGVSDYVNALALESSGNLYAAGNFITAGGVTVNRIAKWDPAANTGAGAWSVLGDGVSDSVNALALDSSGNLYAGGNFITAGGVTVNRVAKWNGTAWSALATGVDNTVLALAVDSGGNALATGNFTTLGGGVLQWDGTNWAVLAEGVKGNLSYMATSSNGTLYTTSGSAIYEMRDTVAVAEASSLTADTISGDVHLVTRTTSNDVNYLRWVDSTETWSSGVSLASGTASDHVGAVLNSASGFGAALWTGADGNIYKKDFSSAGSVAATSDLVATAWKGLFASAESGSGNNFALFGLNSSWTVQRSSFASDGP